MNLRSRWQLKVTDPLRNSNNSNNYLNTNYSSFVSYRTRLTILISILQIPFLSSIILSSPAYGVLISQLIRYARACSSECFILRAVRLSNLLYGQGYVKERLRSSLRKFYARKWDLITHILWGPILPNVTRHSGWWPYTVTPSIGQTLHQFLTLFTLKQRWCSELLACGARGPGVRFLVSPLWFQR